MRWNKALGGTKGPTVGVNIRKNSASNRWIWRVCYRPYFGYGSDLHTNANRQRALEGAVSWAWRNWV